MVMSFVMRFVMRFVISLVMSDWTFFYPPRRPLYGYYVKHFTDQRSPHAADTVCVCRFGRRHRRHQSQGPACAGPRGSSSGVQPHRHDRQ